MQKKAKHAVILIALGCLIIAALVVIRASQRVSPTTDIKSYYMQIYKDVRSVSISDSLQYDYNMIFEDAKVVAIVTPLEDLSTDNTFGIGEKGDIFYGLHSLRKVEVVEYYKNEWNYGAVFTMAEECGLLKDGTLVMQGESYPMQKGDYYLVFLTNSGYKYPLVMSEDNGKFDLSHLSLNSHKDVLIEAIIDLGIFKTEGNVEWIKQAMPLQRVGFGTIDELNERLSQGETWYPAWKLYSVSSKETKNEEKELLLNGVKRWQSFAVTTEYTDKQYNLIIYFSDEGKGKIYRLDGPEAYLDSDDGIIYCVDGDLFA